MARGGRRQAAPAASGRLGRLMQHAARYHELFRERCNYTYVCRRLARCWLERDERKVTSGRHGAAAAERPEETLVNSYVLLQAYALMAVTGLGYLALTWSTVVLLGGFVTNLGRKDFWCLTVISLIQAARIFDDLKDDMVPNLLSLIYKLLNHHGRLSFFDRVARFLPAASSERDRRISSNKRISSGEYFSTILMIPVDFLVSALMILYQLGPFACIVLSSWRLRWRDYGSNDNNSNLTPALDLFYALILVQGASYLFWFFNDTVAEEIVDSVHRRCGVRATWGRTMVAEYLLDTRARCAQEPASIKGRNLIGYAVGLLDSELREKYVSGLRTLDMLIKQQEDVRSRLLLSRPKVQKLIDTLGWRSKSNKDVEIRELAARIVADLAGDIRLAQFPGAVQCIASLLETDQPCWNKNQVLHDDEHEFPHDESSPRNDLLTAVSRNDKLTVAINQCKEEVDQRYKKDDSISGKREVGATCNELILQGLTILEKLASDHHNCRDICNTPGLIPKVMAPIYSKTMINDIVKLSAWANVVNGCVKLVRRLIRAPGRTGKRLHREISCNRQAVSNLESILDQGSKAGQELQMQAVEILTELSLDFSLNFPRERKERLIKKQLQIFLADEVEEEPAAMLNLNLLRATAGNALALLSTISDMVAHLTGLCDADKKNIVARLTELLDEKTNTMYRTKAAEILENLCTHCIVNQEHVKEILLPKVLRTMLYSRTEPQTEKYTLQQQTEAYERHNDMSHENSSSAEDEENRPPIQGNEERTVTKKLQEALLSLTLVIYDNMVSSHGFEDAFKAKAPGDIFVAKLKTIVQENYQATPRSLRIIKLCGQIAMSMIRRQRNQYIEHFKDQNFMESFSRASKIMSDLESSMLFTGTSYRRMRTVRPLLSNLVSDLEIELN